MNKALYRVSKILHLVRFQIVQLLVGQTPVVMNMHISRPAGFQGDMVCFPSGRSIIFANNLLNPRPIDGKQTILLPRRDVEVS